MILNRLSLRSYCLLALASLPLVTSALAGCSTESDGSAENQGTATVSQPTIKPTAPVNTTSSAIAEPTTRAASQGKLATHVADEPSPTPIVGYIEPSHEPGWNDREILVSRSDAIFTGTILAIERVDHRNGPSDLWTIFSVAVDEVLLGDVGGTVSVAQWGGFDPAQNLKVIVIDDALMEVGESYLFLAHVDRSRTSTGGDLLYPHFFHGHVHFSDDAERKRLIQVYGELIVQAGLDSPTR